MTKRLRALLVRREIALNLAHAINDGLADDENMTEAQTAEFDGNMAEVATVNAAISREEALTAEPLDPIEPITQTDQVITESVATCMSKTFATDSARAGQSPRSRASSSA